MAKIDVLLATYNGERFLPELLRSLEEQTFKDWRLVVRDDGSTDGSLAIVEDWASRADVVVEILRDGRTGLGASGNFNALLLASDAPYFALCDQDDVWLPEKLSTMLASLEAAEARRGAERPLLAYSDLRVVDFLLREIHPSFREFSRLRRLPTERPLQLLVIQNVVTGCASLGNAALRKAALPVPEEAMMHDWWLALVAGAFGEIVALPEATILYRQHGDNTVGAKSWKLASALGRFIRDPLAAVTRTRRAIDVTQKQARAFSDRFGSAANQASCRLVSQYGLLSDKDFLHRKLFVIKNSLWTNNFLNNIAFLVAV